MKRVGSAGVVVLGTLVAENGGPFVGEPIGVFGRIEKRVDLFGTFVRIGVGEERFGFLLSWDSAGDVDCDPAKERCVIGKLGRRKAEKFQFGKMW